MINMQWEMSTYHSNTLLSYHLELYEIILKRSHGTRWMAKVEFHAQYGTVKHNIKFEALRKSPLTALYVVLVIGRKKAKKLVTEWKEGS